MDVNENCDIFGDVDFGHGPVEVRCTRTGKHNDHKCEINLIPEKNPGGTSGENSYISASVFDQKEGVSPGQELHRDGGVYSIHRPGSTRRRL